ncbi:F-box only protein 42 [Modicella reniformis]|uniref:F-box only protein 42 n=1 Tax=Modicella reniformis TaxID=1440133 RepID=A0A9P6MA16_9FUNG|nr:F-box only protein 42 [Modicella reniformis]
MDQYKRSNLGMALDPNTGLVYMYGGFQYNSFSSELSVLDTTISVPSKMTWTLATNQTKIPGLYDPVVLFAHTLKKILVMGGCNVYDAGTGLVRTCATLDTVYLVSNGASEASLGIQRQMTTVGPPPRFQACNVVLKNGNIFVQGGKDMSTVFGDAWVLDVVNWTWTKITINGPAAAMTRVGHSCQMGPNGQIIVVGGSKNNTFVTPYMAVIDSNTWTWTTNYKGAPLDNIWLTPQTGGDGGGSSSSGDRPPDGLSSGAKGGIGAGIAIGVLGLGLGFFFWRRRRQSTQQQQQQQHQDPATTGSYHRVQQLPKPLEKSHTTSTTHSLNNNEGDMNRLIHGSATAGAGAGFEHISHPSGPGSEITPLPLGSIPLAQTHMNMIPAHMAPVHMVPAHMIPSHAVPTHLMATYQSTTPISQQGMVPVSHPTLISMPLAPVSHQTMGSIPLPPGVYQGHSPSSQSTMYTTGYQVPGTILSDSSLTSPKYSGVLTTLPVGSGEITGGKNSPPQNTASRFGFPSNPSFKGSVQTGEDAALAAALFQAEDQISSRRSPKKPFQDPIPLQQQPQHVVYAAHIHPTSSSSTSPPLSPWPPLAQGKEPYTPNATTTDRTGLSRTGLPGPQSVPEHEARIERFAPGVKTQVMSTRNLNQDGFYPPLTPTGPYNSHSIVVGAPATGVTSNASSFAAAAATSLPRGSPNRPDMESGSRGVGGSGYFGSMATSSAPTTATASASNSNCNSASSGHDYHPDGLSLPSGSTASLYQSQPYRDPQTLKDLENITNMISVEIQAEPKNPHTIVSTPGVKGWHIAK